MLKLQDFREACAWPVGTARGFLKGTEAGAWAGRISFGLSVCLSDSVSVCVASSPSFRLRVVRGRFALFVLFVSSNPSAVLHLYSFDFYSCTQYLAFRATPGLFINS